MTEKNAGNYLFFGDLDLHRLHLDIPTFSMELLTAWDDLHTDNCEVPN